MSEVKWVKVSTSIFDDEKIKFISCLPNRDTIFYIWIRLIVIAGRCNAGGYVLLTENIPYTEDMLCVFMNRSLDTIKYALDTFRRLGMIDVDSKGIYILNFNKHQNAEGLEKIREQTKKRVAEYRARNKLLEHNDGVTLPVTLPVTQCNATDKDREIDNNIYSQNALKVLSYLNEKTGRRYRVTKYIEARLQDGATVEECKSVIDTKITDSYFIQNPKFLNPETLFRPNHFDRYRNESLPLKIETRKANLDCYVCPRCGRQVPPQDKKDNGCIYCEEETAEAKA